MQLREATQADSTTIETDLLEPAFREDETLDPEFNRLDEAGMDESGCEYWLEDDERTMFVAEIDGELVANASAGLVDSPPIYERGSRAHIDGLYVKPKYRRRGIARRLIERVEDWAIENDCAILGITAHVDNEPARSFYEADFEMKFASYRRWIE